MKKIVIVLGWSVLLVWVGICTAPMDGMAEESETTLKEVVVTATRLKETLSTVPADVTVIGKEEISNSTARDIPDLLRMATGVHVNDISGNGRKFSVDLRSFGETAPLNTLVLVDGQRINQPDLSGTDWTLIPLDRVERIEIVRGGRGSILYGDNASGGVINIITKKGDQLQTKAELAGGSYGTLQSSLSLSGSEKGLSYALSGSHMKSDGYRENSNTENTDAGVKLNYDVNDSIRLNFRSNYHKDSTGLPGSIKKSDFNQGVSRTRSLTPKDFADIKDYSFTAGPVFFFREKDRFKFDTTFRRRTFVSFASFSGGTFQGDTAIDTVVFSPQITLEESWLGLPHRLTAGFDYEGATEDITNTSLFFGSLTKGEFTLEKRNKGYYLHDEMEPVSGVSLSGGYRHSRVNYSFDPGTPGAATMDVNLFTGGINYSFQESSSLYFSYARSFRYPVLDELFSFFTNSVATNLNHQISDDYELGARHDFSETLHGKINLFRIDTNNEIFFNPNTFANENLDGKTRRDGVEISFSKDFNHLALRGSYTYAKAKILGGQFDGKRIPNVPRSKATLDTLFTLHKGLTLGLNGIYIGARPFISDFDNTFGNQEDYVVVNAKLKYHWKNVTAFFDIRNLTNKEYSEFGALGGFPVEEGFLPSPKINFLFGVSLEI
jgi:iron complex outermembrane receptor protein